MKDLYQKTRDFILARFSIVKLIFAFSFFIFTVRELIKTVVIEKGHQSYVMIEAYNLNWSSFGILVLLGILAIMPMVIYDFAVVKFMGRKFKPWIIIENGFIVTALTNIISYPSVLSSKLRARLYNEDDLESEDIARILNKLDVFFPLGLAVFSFLSLISLLFHYNTSMDHYWFWFLGYLCYFIFRFWLQHHQNSHQFDDITFKRQLELCLASILKFSANLGLFLIIGYCVNGSFVDLFTTMSIFVLANIIGNFSLIPAKLGSFDFILIAELKMMGIPIGWAIGWDLVYRIVYYLIPFVLGILLFLFNYGKRFNETLNGIPMLIAQRVARFIVTIFLYFSGVMLLLLATVPNLVLSSHFYLSLEPYTFYFLNQLTTIVIAFVLIGLARGIGSKVRRAYWPTLIVLVIAMANTLWKENFPIQMCIVFGIILVCLLATKGALYRRQLSYSWGQIIMDMFIFAGTFILYTVVGMYNFINHRHGVHHLRYFNDAYLFPSQRIWIAGFIGLIAACLILVLIYRFLSADNPKWLTDPFNGERVHNVIDQFGGNDVSHLAFVRDKHLYFYQVDGEDQLFFMYRHIANKLVIMGEPVGNQAVVSEAIDKFMLDADQEGLSLVFYEVGEQFTMMLHEKGFEFTKAGEEGLVDLAKFTLVGKKHRGERALIHKFERSNFKFEIVQPPFSDQFINELKIISDQWLHGNPEKGFSLGYFDNYYLQQAPIAVMRDQDGKVMAFANLMPSGDHKITSIDLMRSDNEAPSGIMDGIFINLFQASLDEGYQYFNLGMAPLSNVGNSKFSFLDEKIVNLIYRYGQVFYSFQGLRSYKNKYVNLWVPRYITYRRKSSLVFTMLQILIIVNKKITGPTKNGVFSRLFAKND